MEFAVIEPTTANPNSSHPWPYCHLFYDKPIYCDAIIGVKKTIAAFSLIGSLFMILMIWLFRKYKMFAQRLILCLSVASGFRSISYFINDHLDDGPFCDFLGWMSTYFSWNVLAWVCFITFNLYMNAIHMTKTEKFEWVYHVVSWGLPAVISCFPFISGVYGPAELWCWIEKNWEWRFGIWYCPLFIAIAVLFASYTYIYIMINRKVKTYEGLYDPDVERNKQIWKEDVKPLLSYPFIYLAISVFPLANRIQNAVSPDPVFGLMLLHVISSPLQGVLNAVVFGMDRDTRNKLTWDQIKIAILSRRHKTVIMEYPAEVETPSGVENGGFDQSAEHEVSALPE